MDATGVEEAARQGLSLAVLVTIVLAGMRHGFDIDHIATITDIASSQQQRRRSFFLATFYALGHASVVFALGTAAVVLGARISGVLDTVAGRVIGLTLVALGLYVVYSLVRFRRDFRMVSRWMLVTTGIRRVLHRLRPAPEVVIEHEHEHSPGHHEHPHAPIARVPVADRGAGVALATSTHIHVHQHVVPAVADPFTEYSTTTSFVIGMVHGVGAETPTQILLFTTAAGLAGKWAGVILVVGFVTGLFAGNLLLTALATGGSAAGRRTPLVHMGLATVTATLSIVLGLAYLLGRSELLPSFLGG